MLADLRKENAEAAEGTRNDAGFRVSTALVDVSSRASFQAHVEQATKLGEVSGVIHAAGVSPSQALPEVILKVDLYGTSLVLDEFGNVIARGGSAVVIASQSGHRLPGLTTGQNALLATTRVDDPPALPMLQPDQIKIPFMLIQSQSVGTHCALWPRGGALGKARGAPHHHHSTRKR
jgi:hypothetical protein